MTQNPVAPPIPSDYAADRFEGQAVALFELFKANLNKTGEMLIRGKTFENCVIEGPAVLLATSGVRFDNCDLGGADGDMRNLLLQPLAPKRVTGVIAMQDCVFRGCRFFAVGYTGSQGFLDQMLAVGTQPRPND